MKSTFKIALFLMCALLFSETAHAAFTITRTSSSPLSPVFYIDNNGTASAPMCMYASYQITSDTNLADVWVQAVNFTGGVVGLATYEPGNVHLGAMTAGVPKMAYFYLQASGTTAAAQTHGIRVYDPSGSFSPVTQNFTLNSVLDTIQANANTVSVVVSGPNPPMLGGILTITVNGSTGTIGSAPGPNGPLVFSPASFTDWRPDAYQLISTSLVFSGGNNGTYNDQLFIAELPNSGASNYSTIYTFRSVAVTPSSVSISPVGYFASGNQIKHTSLTSGAYSAGALPPSQPAGNTLTISKFVSAPTVPYTGATHTVTYTIRVTNSSTSATAYLDDIADTLPATATYVNNSSFFNGVAIGNPVVSGPARIWYSSFLIPASSFRDLTFQAILPAAVGTYTNTAIGHIGSATIIDTTLATSDNVPASASTVVLAPPVLVKGFSPNTIGSGGASTLTFTLTNPNGLTALSGAAFNDPLPTSPAAMTLSSAVTTNSCGGSLTDSFGNPLAVGSAGVKLANGSIAAGGSCAITVTVAAGTNGTYTNTTGAISSTNAGTGLPASAILTVGSKPAITVAFSPNAIASGATSTVTYTIQNNITSPLTAVTFTDPFPTSPGALTVASPVVTTNTCGGTLTNDRGGVLSAGNTGIRLSNGNIAGSGACSVTIAVTASVQGDYANSSLGVASTETGAAGVDSNTAILTVMAPPLISKAFSPGTAPKDSPSTLTITLSNPNTSGTLTAVGFTDPFPTSPGAMTLYSAATTNTCGGTLTNSAGVPLAIGSASLKLSGGSIPAGGSCTITAQVSASIVGTYNNSTLAVTSLEGGTGGTAGASLVVNLEPSFTKTFASNPIIAGGTSNLTFTITNNNVAGALSNLSFTDVFPTTPGQMSLSSAIVTNTCGGTLTDNTGAALAVGRLGIRLTNGSIATAGASCSITVTIQVTSAGRYTNTSTALTSSAGPANPATAILTAFSIIKSFSPNIILPNGTSTLTLMLNNPDTISGITGVTFNDIFPTTPAQMSLAVAATTNTCGGALTTNAGGALAAGSTSLKLTNGSIAANGNCTITATVKANTLTEGAYANTAGINSVDVLTLTYKPTITLSFSASPIVVNGTSTLTFVIRNNTTLGALSNVSFSNTFPPGLVVATVPALTSNCSGTITGGTAGAGFLNLTGGGSIAAGAASTCTITVAVTSATAGTYANTTSGVSSTESGGAGPVSNTATLLVQMTAPGVAKSFSPNSVAVGVVSQMTISFSNTNVTNINGVAFNDSPYPAGMTNATAGAVVASNTCGGLVTAVNSGTSLSLSGGTIPPGGCSIKANVVGTIVGNQVNSTGPVTSTNAAANAGALGTLVVVNNALLTKAFSPGTVMTGQTSTLAFTITNGGGNPAQSGLGFTDTLPAGVIVNGAPTSPQCNGTVTYPAANIISFVGGSLASGAASCAVTAGVTSSTAGTYTNNSGNISGLAGGLNAAGASATLTVKSWPSIVVLKSVTAYSDPINSTTNPKAIPGATMLYTITVTNTGLGAADNNSIVLTDAVPLNTTLSVDTGAGDPVTFTCSAVPPCGLTWTYASAVSYSSQPGGVPPFNYTPGGIGFDPLVTGVRISPDGQLNGNNASFTVQFKVKVD